MLYYFYIRTQINHIPPYSQINHNPLTKFIQIFDDEINFAYSLSSGTIAGAGGFEETPTLRVAAKGTTTHTDALINRSTRKGNGINRVNLH